MFAPVPSIHPEPIGPETHTLSAGQRLTLRKNADIGRGIHPVTGAALLHPDWRKTCQDCTHLMRAGGHARDFWKCDLNWTYGPATDIRLSWPACRQFTERTDP
jgi:hypothetical protein